MKTLIKSIVIILAILALTGCAGGMANLQKFNQAMQDAQHQGDPTWMAEQSVREYWRKADLARAIYITTPAGKAELARDAQEEADRASGKTQAENMAFFGAVLNTSAAMHGTTAEQELSNISAQNHADSQYNNKIDAWCKGKYSHTQSGLSSAAKCMAANHKR